MCAPGTKEWRTRRVWMLGLFAFAIYAVTGLAVWQFFLAFGAQHGVELQDPNVGPWTSPGRFKTYASAEVLGEV